MIATGQVFEHGAQSATRRMFGADAFGGLFVERYAQTECFEIVDRAAGPGGLGGQLEAPLDSGLQLELLALGGCFLSTGFG